MDIKITNDFNKQILFSLEPNGTIIELEKLKSLNLELIANGKSPILELKVGEFDGNICIAIWPDQGDYEVNG
ncbi:hypothetical protein [Pedobacter ghigonis]|uniref:hypothetical protein n=1 Tax=Pedobacter ghigonis TaxID=2730403 RepID=UPI00158B6FE8|nr:hypothetical protein [Pedobacter ghigonis]